MMFKCGFFVILPSQTSCNGEPAHARQYSKAILILYSLNRSLVLAFET